MTDDPGPIADNGPRRPGEGEPRAALGRGLGSLLAREAGAGTFGGLDRHDAWVRDHGSALRPVVRVAAEARANFEGPTFGEDAAGEGYEPAVTTVAPEVTWVEPPTPPSIADPVADDEPEVAEVVSVAQLVPERGGATSLSEALARLKAMGVDG